MTNVFVVILNWNRADDTLECLKSVGRLKVTGFQLSVVVVDNASSDNSVAIINNQKSKIKNLKVKVIENSENKGYAGGNNVGIKHALKNKADYVLVLNNDTIIDKNMLIELLKIAKRHKQAAILSPKIYFAKGYEFHKKSYKKTDLGKVIWSAGGEMDWDNVFGKNYGVDKVDRGQFEKTKEIDFATGACMFLSAKALKEVGIFDSRYFMYFEDADLCLRMIKKGWKIYYVPEAHVWHKVAQSSGIGSDLNDYFISRNRMLFGMQYAPLSLKVNLMDQSFRFILKGRKWQRKGAIDFYIGKYGKGSWISN